MNSIAQKVKNTIKQPVNGILFLSRNGLLKWIPDEAYIKIIYKMKNHKKLNLTNPVTFSEKIQWLKLYDHKKDYIMMVDKVLAKEYVKQKIGNKYIIPTYKTWEKVEDICIDELPNQFVLKVNHDSGGVVICKDKSQFDLYAAKKKLKRNFANNGYWYGREWPYKHIKACVFAEQLLIDNSIPQQDTDIPDYKFYCFDGVPMFCQVICNRRTNETIDFYDMNWNHQPFVGLHECPNASTTIQCPSCFEEMKKAAGILSAGMKFIRVDFYCLNGQMYFGELTLYPASGLGKFTPDDWNYKLGELIKCK